MPTISNWEDTLNQTWQCLKSCNMHRLHTSQPVQQQTSFTHYRKGVKINTVVCRGFRTSEPQTLNRFPSHKLWEGNLCTHQYLISRLFCNCVNEVHCCTGWLVCSLCILQVFKHWQAWLGMSSQFQRVLALIAEAIVCMSYRTIQAQLNHRRFTTLLYVPLVNAFVP